MKASTPSKTFVLVFLLWSISSRVHAQASLGGVVKDDSGNGVLAGVTVEAEGNGLRQKAVVVTDSKGEFTFAGLQPGAYTLTFTLAGFDFRPLQGIEIKREETTVVAVAAVDEGCRELRTAGPCLSYRQVAGRVPQAFRPLWMQNDRDVAVVRAQYPCESISFSSGGGLGFTPGASYAVVLFRDGRAELKSRETADKETEYVGEITSSAYGKLCYLTQQLRIDGLARWYSRNVTDDGGMTLGVKFSDREVVVSDYAGSGPIELWALQIVVDALKQQIEWKARP